MKKPANLVDAENRLGNSVAEAVDARESALDQLRDAYLFLASDSAKSMSTERLKESKLIMFDRIYRDTIRLVNAETALVMSERYVQWLIRDYEIEKAKLKKKAKKKPKKLILKRRKS